MISKEQTKDTTKKPTQTKYNAPVISYEGDLCLELPDDLLEELNWKVGDVLEWTKVATDRYILKLARKDNE